MPDELNAAINALRHNPGDGEQEFWVDSPEVSNRINRLLDAIPPGSVLIALNPADALDAADAIADEWALGGNHPMQVFAAALRKAAGA